MNEMNPKISTTKDLRKFLIDKIGRVADGKIGLDVAKGISSLSQQIYNSLLIEVKIAKARNEIGDVKAVDLED